MEIEVSDTGPRFWPTTSPSSVFKPFVTTKPPGGMGVGLSISKAHRGRLMAGPSSWSAMRMAGRHFRFTVPAIDQEADAT